MPAGATNNDSIIWAMDWLPTISSFAGIDIDKDFFDGENVGDILTGESNRSRSTPLLWKVPHFNINSKVVILYEDYKLHMWKATKNNKKQRMELYNLKEDPGEEFDLQEEYPEIANALAETMFDWEDQLPKVYVKGNEDPLPFNSATKPYVPQPPILPGLKLSPTSTAAPTTKPTDFASNDWAQYLFLNRNRDGDD